MAFFKFRFPGQNASTDAVTPGPSENIEVVRRRARHRLMGAVVLVLVAVVGFPLLFDTQPRPVAVDTPIVIPDRQNTPPLASAVPVPAAQAPAKPLLPTAESVPTQASLDAREQVVSAPAPVTAPVAATAKPEAAKQAPAADKSPDKPAAAKPEPKPAATAKTEKTEPVVRPKDDGDKAQALLEGKAAKPTAERVVIQVGAFADAAKVREIRSKLEQAGVKTYTQTVEKDGKSTTRIRVGPFESKEEAEKAAARIRKLDLPVSILKI
jgi:DedD protein